MDGKMEDQSKSGQKQRNNFLQKEDQNERKANGQHQNEQDKNPMDEKHEILRSHTGCMTATLAASLGAAQNLYRKASLLLEQVNIQDAL
ncbi:hypothetical protein MTP99_002049 [Tenebrio molitor]|nr:hypothetical protein MTP99_002049 [Tenebrio molitor]